MTKTKNNNLRKSDDKPDKALKVIGDEINLKSEDGVVKVEISLKNRQKATGFKTDATDYVLNATLSAIGQMLSAKEIEEIGEQLILTMSELAPIDGFEGVLISQMLTAYDQAMKCFRKADVNINSSKIYDRYMNHGVKLMRLYAQQLEALDKHRRKGKQKMIVEHVHVHEGGQAIVGNVNQGENV